MTLHSDIWRLPGPGSFVRDIARHAAGGQHVLAIVPRHIAIDSEYSDALAVAVLAEIEGSRRVFPAPNDGALVSALGFNMTDTFDDAPATVPDLIAHDDVVGRSFVCNAGDLDPLHRNELPAFLKRLDDESRPLATTERAAIVFVLDRTLVPQDPASVATTRLWYWDRVARWDVAALLAGLSDPEDFAGLLGEVRLETAIEVARWDFTLAAEIIREWSGEESGMIDLLQRKDLPAPPDTAIRRNLVKQPPESHIELWEEGWVESWHGSPSIAPAMSLKSGNGFDRLLWSAQARVLLPWLEVRRVRIEQKVSGMLGPTRMAAAVAEYATRFPDVELDTDVVEFATLARIVSARFGRSEERLRMTTKLLLGARNRLAHLRPLAQAEIEEMERTCAWLH